MKSQNTFAAIKTGIPYTAEQMSKAIHQAMCERQMADYAYGEDANGNSLEIHWHNTHESWQLISRVNGQPTVNYDLLHETSLEWEEPSLLLSLCEHLDIVDELQQELEEEDIEEEATLEWFMSLPLPERTKWLSAVKQHSGLTEEQIIHTLTTKEAV
jgi:hypothetical protein